MLVKVRVKVNLTKRIRLGETLRYCPVVEDSKGRPRPDVVMVDGKEERHTEGSYYLDWTEAKGGKRIRVAVGQNVQDANNARDRRQAELNAVIEGAEIVNAATMVDGQTKRSLAAAIAVYLAETKGSKKPKTFDVYRKALEYFTESCHKVYLEDIDRTDLLKFRTYLKSGADHKAQSDRSITNKFMNVLTFLKSQKVKIELVKGDRPKFTEQAVEVYEREELDRFFDACDAEERLWFEFFLMTGMREQEVMHLYWTDVNVKACIVKVTAKPDLGWTPKTYEERPVPIPSALAAKLQAAKDARDADGRKCSLVFPTAGCNPKLDFLDCCKAIAKRAGLNPSDFWLHKFRATFATWTLHGGVDLRTTQSYMGHRDIESTMRYLAPSRNPEVREKQNVIFAMGGQS